MAEVDDWGPASGQVQGDDWQPVAPAAVNPPPKAFMDRVRSGQAFDRAVSGFTSAAKGFKEGFGNEPVGMSDEHVHQLQEAGIYRDPATGRGGLVRLANESVLQPAAAIGDLALRSVSGGVHAIGHIIGQMAADAEVPQADKIQSEAINFLNYELMRGDHARIEHGADNASIDRTVGRLPAEADFKAAADALGPKFAGESLPSAGVAPANMAADGTIYVGKPNSMHFAISEQHAPKIRADLNLQPGDATWRSEGFVTPDGQYLDRKQSFDWVSQNEKRVRSSDNMEPGELDSQDYYEQVPESARTKRETIERNLRDLWDDRGIHPAEAAHDARTDAFLKGDLTRPSPNPLDRSGMAPPRGSTVPEGTPRTELAKTGEAHIDAVLDSPVTRRNIDNPVIDDRFDVPYSAGGSVPLEDPTMFIDRHFPRSMTIEGVTFDPAEPFTIHENLEQHVMERLTAGGMSPQSAYKVAHFEYAEKSEGAWYAAHGIDQAKAEEAYRPFLDQIQHENPENPPPNLYKKPYPHDDVNAAKGEPLAEPLPTKAEIAQAKAILDSEEGAGEPLRAVGAEVTGEMPDLTQQPPVSPGRLSAAVQKAGDTLLDIGRDAQMLVAPMARGTRDSMAIAKDFANAMRRNRWEWARHDAELEKKFTPEQRARMFNAMDEESVAIQLGESREHQGLATLEPAERAAVEDLDRRQQIAWMRARDLGMVEGEGIPMHATRMVMNITNASTKDGALSLDMIGRNLTVRTPWMKQRKHMTVEETEAAAKAKFGPEAVVARDIRAVALSTGKLEDAIAGRSLVNNIAEYGKRTGSDTIAEGFKPADSDVKWFTLDHPALKTWRPKFKDGAAVKDDAGNVIFEQVPIYIRSDFEGPLRAVLSQSSGALYGAAMALKGKSMSLIMNSPLIHNAVEWGRAIPAMPGKVATFKVYFEGNRAKNDPALMGEAIDAGLVPIGHRFFNQDITSIMEGPNLTPGRSWTSQVLAAVPGLFDEAAGTAVKRAIDKAGDFWHNTLLWDRVGDLQMGLYTNFRADMMAKDIDRRTASLVAAHWANRYAGALPQEAMSDGARKIANMMLFSRSFTLGNLGVMKDMLTGLPKDVIAQVERDAGFRAGSINEAGELAGPEAEAVKYAKGLARRKAMAVVGLDIALMYVGNSILQSAINVMSSDTTMDKEMHGYAERMKQALQERAEHPLKLLQPFNFLEEVSSTSQNEPGRQDRIRVGQTKDGTAIYARNPVGKIGEEFTGYLTGPLDMMRRKFGTIARPAWQIMSNDAGYGRKVYDPNADTPEKYLANLGKIAGHIAKSQVPEGQFTAASDLVKGEGDPKLAALQTFGPFTGVTFSKGAPGGPAIGEMYQARAMHEYQVQAALPGIRRQIQRGDVPGAQAAMGELGIPPGLQKFYIRTSLNPATRLSPKALKDFYQYATPEQRERFERAR